MNNYLRSKKRSKKKSDRFAGTEAKTTKVVSSKVLKVYEMPGQPFVEQILGRYQP